MFNIRSDKNIQPKDKQTEIIIPVSENTKKQPSSSNNTKNYKKKEYSAEEIKDLLVGYVEVPIAEWTSIPKTAHVRYFKKDGTFVRGGFVVHHWKKESKNFTILANAPFKSPTYTTWSFGHDNIQKIFKKIDPKTQIEIGVVKTKTGEVINEINKLITIVKAQQEKINEMEKNIEKLYMLVKFNNTMTDSIKKKEKAKKR